jgi:hypothetical protein
MSNIIEIACKLPIHISSRNVSPKEYIRSEHLHKYRNEITYDNIYSYLLGNPLLVDDWLSWSQDKRYSSAWYFVPRGQTWVIAHSQNGNEESFVDRTKACAKFIQVELEDLMSRKWFGIL